MNRCTRIIVLAVACLLTTRLVVMAEPPAKPSAKPQSLDELMVIIETMQRRIAQLESKVQSLETALAAAQSTTTPKAPATATASVILITSIEPTEPDPDALAEISRLKDAADDEEAAAQRA